MPEAEKKEDSLSKEPMVDLDTSGPGANVELPENENEETKTYEKEEKKNEANVTWLLITPFFRSFLYNLASFVLIISNIRLLIRFLRHIRSWCKC